MARARVLPTGTYTQWQWPARSAGYDSFEWQVTPGTDPSPDGYFWSHQFWLAGGEAGYVGLQTRGSEPVGKIAIFSVWRAVAARSAVHAAPFAGEGEGFTARIPFAWVPGTTYDLRIARDTDGWWAAWAGELLVGAIQVPARWGGLGDVSVMWTERYSGPLSSCADLRYSVARFSVPSAHGGQVVPLAHRNYLASPPGCGGSSVTDAPGGVVHVMGGSIPEP